jgi:hypothetical protein
VTFFANDGINQPAYDGRVVQFNFTRDLPAPPRVLLYEHYKQAVLANIKGTGQPRDLDFDPSEDAQTMSTFETDPGKDWFEAKMVDKLALYDGNLHRDSGNIRYIA